MTLLPIIFTIVIVGVVMWLINSYIPMEPGIKRLLNVVVVVLLIIWLLHLFGAWSYLSNVRI